MVAVRVRFAIVLDTVAMRNQFCLPTVAVEDHEDHEEGRRGMCIDNFWSVDSNSEEKRSEKSSEIAQCIGKKRKVSGSIRSETNHLGSTKRGDLKDN